MNEQVQAALKYLDEATAALQHAASVLTGMDDGGAKPQERLLFCSPVTGKIELLTPWGGDWFDATGYATYYTPASGPAYHTGCDLNRPNFADSGAAVYASADGQIVYSGEVKGWQGQVIIIRHRLESGELIWTRYAHITTDTTMDDVRNIATVKRGVEIGRIADYNQDGPKGDHLHFDVAWLDLGDKPGDWPGMDLERLKRNYIDPDKWLRERSV